MWIPGCRFDVSQFIDHDISEFLLSHADIACKCSSTGTAGALALLVLPALVPDQDRHLYCFDDPAPHHIDRY